MDGAYHMPDCQELGDELRPRRARRIPASLEGLQQREHRDQIGPCALAVMSLPPSDEIDGDENIIRSQLFRLQAAEECTGTESSLVPTHRRLHRIYIFLLLGAQLSSCNFCGL
ncbi:hypothetical protein BDA96_05G019100 [Sorghum bicolor]|uniref:Uncharacterized protein n=1 Tax=Sorghum bicolor TaxID=4558 RepID=A0A921UEA8_SORBI|nr:hypothetical protein BDA96_05G019100 [Sorghum bicolor]